MGDPSLYEEFAKFRLLVSKYDILARIISITLFSLLFAVHLKSLKSFHSTFGFIFAVTVVGILVYQTLWLVFSTLLLRDGSVDESKMNVIEHISAISYSFVQSNLFLLVAERFFATIFWFKYEKTRTLCLAILYQPFTIGVCELIGIVYPPGTDMLAYLSIFWSTVDLVAITALICFNKRKLLNSNRTNLEFSLSSRYQLVENIRLLRVCYLFIFCDTLGSCVDSFIHFLFDLNRIPSIIDTPILTIITFMILHLLSCGSRWLIPILMWLKQPVYKKKVCACFKPNKTTCPSRQISPNDGIRNVLGRKLELGQMEQGAYFKQLATKWNSSKSPSL
ncbi:hypothetical protein AB6A40_003852 [Gnathostoma spinigerum]|uniref:Gustatory receptor n=1 Tax=Gnathostoma spinigerum TaxID=75299 RepID=A0ABD6EJJ3_9BILA